MAQYAAPHQHRNHLALQPMKAGYRAPYSNSNAKAPANNTAASNSQGRRRSDDATGERVD